MRIPIACTLDGTETRERWLDWRRLLSEMHRVERDVRYLTLGFPADPLTRMLLARLVEAERACCGFVEWQLSENGNELTLGISGEPEGINAMAAAFQLAD